MAWLLVVIGSALGGMARYGISGAVARRVGETFPWGTLVVNVSGSFVIGVFAALVAPGGALAGERMAGAFVMVGLCGGYTTFSAFSLQTLNLMNDGECLYAGAYIGLSVALCLIAVWAGAVLAAGINTMKWI